MRRQFWRLWRRGRNEQAAGPPTDELSLPQPGAASSQPGSAGSVIPGSVTAGAGAPDVSNGLDGMNVRATQQAGAPFPEQPVLLTPGGAARPVHIGELLPARQRRWPLSVVRLPVVPKRAILAAGVCAGLAAPQIARHLATRLLLGSLARGVAWAEASGRASDGSWLELRLHHRPSERRLQAGLLAYQPLARGGRTVVVGDQSLSYTYDPGEVAHHLADDVARWLQQIAAQKDVSAIGAA